jgi:hypothetical protein
VARRKDHPARLSVVAGAIAVAGLAFAVARSGDRAFGAAPAARPAMRGPVGYPALPALPPATGRRRSSAAPTAARAPAPRPPDSDWTKAVELVDLPLRKIAADTSVLELGYRPFAEACVDALPARTGGGAGRGDWLASLKTIALRTGVTLRDRGATVDCETARKGLVVRANALKADLDVLEALAATKGVRPADWRRLLASRDVEAWSRY